MSSTRINQIEPWLDQQEEKAVMDVLRSGWITEAHKTKEFEDIIAKFVGSTYCSVLTNGTVTLFAALAALGIGRGDEVILPDFTMVASANAIGLTGAKPVFVDIEKENLCLSLNDIEKKITKKTKAIMAVALNGRSPDMQKLMKLVKKYKIFLVEDAAQALGCYYKGKHLGTFGDIGSFSFSTPKIITTGQGGALVTDKKELYENIVKIKDFGRINRNSQDHDAIGYNFKFTDIQAAIGLEQMKKLPWRLTRKKEMYQKYYDLLHDIPQITFLQTDLTQTAPWFIDIFVPYPKALQAYLKTEQIGTREFYPAIHTTKPYQSRHVFPHSLWAATHGLWLPSSTFLTNDDIIKICKAIRTFYEKN